MSPHPTTLSVSEILIPQRICTTEEAPGIPVRGCHLGCHLRYLHVMPRSSPRPRRDGGSGSVFERTTTTRQGKTITRFVATLELPSIDGTRRRKTIYGKSRQDALERMAKARTALDKMGNLPTSDPTVAQWCALWVTEHGRRLKPSVLPGYRSKIDRWIVPVLGRHKLTSLTPDHVRGLHRTMREGGAATNHVLGVHRVLSSLLTDAMSEERVHRNVAKIAGGRNLAGIRGTSPKRTPRRSMSIEQAVKVMVIGQTADPVLGSRWPFAFLTGQRQGERLGLTWPLLDLDQGVADVSWALARVPWAHGCTTACGLKAHRCPSRRPDIEPDYDHRPLEANYVLQRPKTDSSQRLTPLVGWLIDPLRRRYEQVLTERPAYTVDHGLVWCRPDGGPIRPREDWQTWKDLLAQAGVEDFTQHEIRHTTVTILSELGIDRSTISEIVGHSDVLTQEAYKHVSLDVARAALDRLGHALELPAAAVTV